MTTLKFTFLWEDEGDLTLLDELYDNLSRMGAYDIDEVEVEPPKTLPLERQRKLKG